MTTEFSRRRVLRAAAGTATASAIVGLVGVPASGEVPDGRTGFLEAPGAALYYETYGSGPLLLMIAGAAGSADSFRGIAAALAAGYTVCLYDRRGFSRSQLRGPQDYEHRLETDADDARRLIEHLSDQPAVVFGNSSGAQVALAVLARHPAVVRTLVPHEPAAVRLLPDGTQWVGRFHATYELYRRSGTAPAMQDFAAAILTASDRASLPPPPANGQPILVNNTYWFERELRQYPVIRPDLDTLCTYAGRIVPVAGEDSRGFPCHEVAVQLARRLNRELTELPGGHLGFLSAPGAFAGRLLDVLAAARQ